MERSHIWVKYTSVWGIISPMKWVVNNELTQLRKCVCYSQKIYPKPPRNLHGYIRHQHDISQLCVEVCWG